MYRKSYRLLALVFVFALVLGAFAAMVPTAAEAAGLGGQPPRHMWGHGGQAHFSPNQLPNPFVRDFDGDQVWWGYVLKHGRYHRVYAPTNKGDVEVSYRKNVRSLWAANSTAEVSGGQ